MKKRYELWTGKEDGVTDGCRQYPWVSITVCIFDAKLQERALDNNNVFYKVDYLAAAISEFHHV